MSGEQQQPGDPKYMRQALELARGSRPSPNPRVGAVVVKDGRAIGTGRHECAGAAHAEVVALDQAGSAAHGADLYVTLEPCCHQGRTPPCTGAIERAGIARVIIATIDPDPRVSGGGVRLLQLAGCAVETGLLEDECRELLEGYATHRLRGRPLITIKAAVTLDGALATASGHSQWITSAPARVEAHALRVEADAVAVGVETVLADDPQLTVRHLEGPNPLRVVLDSRLRTPQTSKLVTSAAATPLLLAHTEAAANTADFAQMDGVETVRCAATAAGHVDVADLTRQLAERGVLSLLVEGGGRVHGSFIAAGQADRLALFVAPKLIGPGIPWARLTARQTIDEAISLEGLSSRTIGDDVLLSGRWGPSPWDSETT